MSTTDNTTDKFAILIDTSSFIHRNFHAMEPVVGHYDGHPMDVAAVQGYVKYVGRHIYGPNATLKTDIVIHALDSAGGSDYRRQLHPEYKGNRSDKHPALIAQEAMTGRVLKALGEHVVQQRGVEADDLIGSLTRKLVAAGYKVCIITGDKDLMQLVKDGEVVLARYEKVFGERGNQHVFYEENDVFAKLNVYPSQVAGYLALMGDDVDNIGGVKGIGKGTAAKLMQEYGSFEGLLTRADEIKGKMGEKLRAAKEDGTLDLCYKLTLPLFDLDIDLAPFGGKALQNEADARTWHKTLRLEEANMPLRLSEFGQAPGYVHPTQPSTASAPTASAPTRSTAPPAGVTITERTTTQTTQQVAQRVAPSAPAPTPVAPVAAAPAPVATAPVTQAAPASIAPASTPLDDFLGNDDPFGEALDDAFQRPFTPPPVRTVAQTEPAPAATPPAPAAPTATVTRVEQTVTVVEQVAVEATPTETVAAPAPVRRFQRRPG